MRIRFAAFLAVVAAATILTTTACDPRAPERSRIPTNPTTSSSPTSATPPPLPAAVLKISNPGVADGPIREAFFTVHTLSGLSQVNGTDPSPVSRTVILRLEATGLSPDSVASQALPAVGTVVTHPNGRWIWQVVNASGKPATWTFTANFSATAALDILGCAVTYEGLIVNKDGPYQARRVGDQLEVACTFTL